MAKSTPKTKALPKTAIKPAAHGAAAKTGGSKASPPTVGKKPKRAG
jgi:hypothetical protein